MPRRTVHLDFHTGPQVPGVGVDFDPDVFAATLRAARAESVTVFAKCHHGHLYHRTAHPARHPHLVPGLDLLAAQVDALHRVGIQAPVYLSVQVDEHAADRHPEWLAWDEHGTQVKKSKGRFDPGWQVLDMDSPYQDYLADQLDEVLRHLGRIDGLFLDMCWDQPSTSRWAVDAMRRSGLDPRDPADRDRHARAVAHTYMARYRAMVLPRLAPDATGSVWFNSRPKTALRDEVRFVDHVEIEALPTGGWGYTYLPYVARFVRDLGVPALAHTGRFHKSWGDNGGLKPAAALKYECCQMLMFGLTAGVGDLMHPSGALSPVTYRLIGDAYRYLERCEPFVAGARRVREVAVVMDPELGDAPGPVGVGVVRALQQLRVQFDVVDPDTDLAPYRVVVVPETTTVVEPLRAALQDHLAAGGGLLVAGAAAQDDAGKPVLDELGLAEIGSAPFSHTFIRVGAGDSQFDHVMYEPSLRLLPRPEAQTLFAMAVPYFERTWDRFSGHDYTPVAHGSGYAAAVRNGAAVTVGAPIFTAYGRHAPVAYLEMLEACFAHVLPRPVLRTGGPRHLETTVVDTDDSRVVHLLSFLGSRQGEGVSPITAETEGIDLVHDAFPLVEVPVQVRMDAAPSRVQLQPHDVDLPFEYVDGYVRLTVDISDGHGMVVVHR